MKQLIGLISKLKYQTREYIPNTLHDCTDEQQAAVEHAIKDIEHTANLIDHYIHNKIGYIIEVDTFINNIEMLRKAMINNGMNAQRLDLDEADFNRIINLFTYQLNQPHNQEYFLHLLHWAVNTWLYEKEQNANAMAQS